MQEDYMAKVQTIDWKKWLAAAGVLFLLVASYSVIVYVNAYSNAMSPGGYRSFGVTGEGKVTTVPDVAVFSASVITQGGNDIAGIQKQNTDKMNAIITFLKKNGVEEKDIKTTNYNLNPRYQSYRCEPNPFGGVVACPPASIIGYEINQSVEVKVRDFAKAGEMLAGVSESGANSVSRINFTVDDRAKLEAEARALAVKEAKEKAQIIAKAGGFRVGDLLSIDDYYDPYPMYDSRMGMGGAESMEMAVASAPAIEPGSEEIIVRVNARYEIK